MKRHNAARALFVAAGVVLSVAVGAATPACSAPPKCWLDDPTGRPAELFATDNTAVITDPDDNRLRDPLQLFEIQVNTTILRDGLVPAGSTLVDGVFWSDEMRHTTYERSREFHLCGADEFKLHSIADEVRSQFDQESVLTFEFLPEDAPATDAVVAEVPHIDAVRFHDALAADPVAQKRVVGGSLTPDHTLIVVVDTADIDVARQLVAEAGGQWEQATFRYGNREFVG